MILTKLSLAKLSLSIVLFRSSDTRPIAWCVIGFFVGIYLFIQGFRLLQRRHLILDTPVSKVRSASMGMVELSGLAVGPYTMVAPITERACYYYRTVAWEWKQCGKNKQWVKVAAECMHVPFFLDDNTGKVMVDPRGAELDLHCDFEQQFCDSFFTTKQEAPPNVHSFLSRHGVSTTNKIKVQEFCIKPKNALFLLGTLDENPGLQVTEQPIQDEEHNTLTFGNALHLDTEFQTGSRLAQSALSFVTGSYHVEQERSVSEMLIGGRTFNASASGGQTKAIQLSPAGGPATASDMTQQEKIAAALLKAGIGNPAAWAAAGVTGSAAHAQTAVSSHGSSHGSALNTGVEPQPSQLKDFESHPAIVLMKGKNNPTFLISWRSQRDLARSLGWKCTLMIWGGPAVALLCLYCLHAMTHWF